MKATTIMKKAPIDWEKTVIRMDGRDKHELRKELEGVAERAGMLAAYIEERADFLYSDQGHEKALKEANRAGRLIHCRVFGYNEFRDLRI